jgi:hypothetical protein
MITNADITIFNKVYNAAARRNDYKGTFIQGVSFVKRNAVLGLDNSSGSLTQGDTYTIRIPLKATTASGKAYQTYLDAASFTGHEEGHWTIQNGDLIVKGDATSLKDVSPATIEKAYSDVCLVTDYSVNMDRGTKAVQHFRIGGK